MALKQIPNLPPVLGLVGNEQIELVQAGVSSRAAISQIEDWFRTRPTDPRKVVIHVGPTAPVPATDGQLWFYTEDAPGGGALYIRYNDGNTTQWVPASPYGSGSGGGTSVTTSDTPPNAPVDGDLWWDSVAGRLFLWFIDPDGGQWVPATPSVAGPVGPAGPAGGVARTTALTYYVATTGSDANDGASAASPVLTIARALAIVTATVAYSPGPVTIQIAAGTYTQSSTLTFSYWLFMGSPLTFKGTTSGGIPTTIIQGSTDGTRLVTFFNGGAATIVVFQDIKFQSFSAPMRASQLCRVVATNVHAVNCLSVMSIGVTAIGAAFGGNWDGRDLGGVVIPDSIGFVSAIGSNWNLQQSPPPAALVIHHFERGMVCTEVGSGHLDYMQFEDCTDCGADLMRGAGAANMSGIVFRRMPVGIRSVGPMAGLLVSDNAIFDAVPMPIQRTDGATFSVMESAGWDSRLSYCIRGRTENFTYGPGSTTETNYFSIEDIVPNRMRAHDRIIIRMMGSANTLAGICTLRLKFGPSGFAGVGGVTAGTFTVPVGTTNYELDIMLVALDKDTVTGRGRVISDNGTTSIFNPIVRMQNVTIPGLLTELTNMTITAQHADALNSINLFFGTFDSTIAGLVYP